MNHTGPQIVTGCSQIPKQIGFKDYFVELDGLETTLLIAGAPKNKTLKNWRSSVDEDVEFSINTPALHFGNETSFFDGQDGKRLAEAASILKSQSITFSNTNDFSTSAANRASLAAFFENATKRLPKEVSLFWFPKGLWDLPLALEATKDVQVLIGFDPLANDALNESSSAHLELFSQKSVYLRIEQTGHKKRRFDSNELQVLAEILQNAEKAWVFFDNQGAFADSKVFKKMISNPL